MKKNSKMDDFLKISGGVINALQEAKDFSKEKLKYRLNKLLESSGFAKKKDFELLKAMLIKIKEENQLLSKKVKLLEKKAK